MRSLRMLALIGLAVIVTGATLGEIDERRIDLDSYCKGLCSARYEDGVYLNGKCACMDMIAVKPPKKLDLPKRFKSEPEAPHVYDGIDVIHYAEGE